MTILAGLLVAAGLVAIAWGWADRRRVRADVLREIVEAELAEPGSRPDAVSELLERAGAFADRALGHSSFTERIERRLAQAGWTLRTGEFAAMLVGAGVLSGAVAGLTTGSLIVAFAAAAWVPCAWVAWLSAKGRKRVRAVEAQLPTVLQVLASSLASGSSVLHAMEVVVEEGKPPLSHELRRVVSETRVGRPLIEALEGMATRIGSRDVDWTVEAIRIQQQAGGKLADTLHTLAEFMRVRLEVRGEVRALSAEARLSGKVLTALPLALGGFLLLYRPGYLEPLYTTSVGRWMLAVAGGGIVFATVWMRRIVRVEV